MFFNRCGARESFLTGEVQIYVSFSKCQQGVTLSRVVAAVERDLLTPYGLRSLASYDPQYRGHLVGDPASRDSSYHQGTVWAWLMGPFITAYLKVHGAASHGRQQAAQWLAGFRQHISDAGLGQVSEIFDGDPPYLPRGCIAQAWSVAELLRAAAELGRLETTTEVRGPAHGT